MGNKLILSELDKPQRILDIGTGTGIWAIEIGRRPSFLLFLAPLEALAWRLTERLDHSGRISVGSGMRILYRHASFRSINEPS